MFTILLSFAATHKTYIEKMPPILRNRTVPLANFKTFTVPNGPQTKMSIWLLAKNEKLNISRGISYYQLTKPEQVRSDRTVLVQMTSNPRNLITGASAQALLGAKARRNRSGGVLIDPDAPGVLRVYVQSTSHNHMVIGGTMLLYQTNSPKNGKSVWQAKPERRVARLLKQTKAKSVRVPRVARSTMQSSPKPAQIAPISQTAQTSSISQIALAAPIFNIVPPVWPVAGGTGELIEIVFSFDTTKSMYPCLATVRNTLKTTLKRLTG